MKERKSVDRYQKKPDFNVIKVDSICSNDSFKAQAKTQIKSAASDMCVKSKFIDKRSSLPFFPDPLLNKSEKISYYHADRKKKLAEFNNVPVKTEPVIDITFDADVVSNQITIDTCAISFNVSNISKEQLYDDELKMKHIVGNATEKKQDSSIKKGIFKNFFTYVRKMFYKSYV